MIGLVFLQAYCLAVEAAILSRYPNPVTVAMTVFVACLFAITLAELTSRGQSGR